MRRFLVGSGRSNGQAVRQVSRRRRRAVCEQLESRTLLATLNIVGGFVVTDRMLEMFKAKPAERPAKGANAAADTPADDATGGAK